MSGPRTKRQFAGAASDPSQRQITSFFGKSSSSVDSAATSSKSAALNGPHLPAQVQTDLLTVGMRVRKAIPEGYKTHNTPFQLWADDSSSHTTPTTSNTASTCLRELEPFCGLNKVGGLAFQPSHHVSTAPDYDYDTMPGLTGSQDSATSTLTPTPPARALPRLSLTSPVTLPTRPRTRKRIFLPDDEDESSTHLSAPLPHAGPFRLGSRDETWLDDEISPLSMAPPPGLWENARVLAVPRRSPRQQSHGGRVGRKGAVVGVGAEVDGEQENVMVVVRGDEDGKDFEEASFLDYGLGGPMEV
ncbi:hypothetical protein BT67DRAFT_439961, partial [Trichocladium antarcticum]